MSDNQGRKRRPYKKRKTKEEKDLDQSRSMDLSPTRKLHKRGRKIIEDSKYYEDGEKKINELKDLLDKKQQLGASVKERQKIRNQLSA
jgi:hypothetical protein